MFVPETTIKTEWIYHDTFISIPRQVRVYTRANELYFYYPLLLHLCLHSRPRDHHSILVWYQ